MCDYQRVVQAEMQESCQLLMSSHVYEPFNAESLAVAKIDLYPLPWVKTWEDD